MRRTHWLGGMWMWAVACAALQGGCSELREGCDQGQMLDGNVCRDPSPRAPDAATMACPTGLTLCDGFCLDTRTDEVHCGRCGQRCASTQVCLDSVCSEVMGCAEPRRMCGGVCVDTSSDNAHCSICGAQCPSDMMCSSGRCVCGAGLTACASRCVDLQADRANCGACSRVCSSGQTCSGGACIGGGPMPDCAGRECGPDGAGGSCGNCLAGSVCSGVGRCVPPAGCQTGCVGRECGPDPGTNCAEMTCGTAGGACPGGAACNASGRCTCVRNCAARSCGSDGCGGQCGTCPSGTTCNEATGTCGCVPNCGGRTCGPSNCPGVNCGSPCPRGFFCNASGTGCTLDPSSRWVIRVVDGRVSTVNAMGTAWDIGGLPDARVCIRYTSGLLCTPEASDTLTPRWNVDFPSITANFLTEVGVPVTIEDVDTTFNEVICTVSPTWPASQLRDGRGTITCGTLAVINIEFRVE